MTEPTTCDASWLGPFEQPAGPCVLRHGHDGPVHQGANGAQWWLHTDAAADAREVVDACADLQRKVLERDQQLTAVRALHVRNANSGSCEHCSERDYPGYDVQWPCPTMRALGEQLPPPKCPRCKGHGKVPDWTNWDAYHGEPKPKPCPDCITQEPTP